MATILKNKINAIGEEIRAAETAALILADAFLVKNAIGVQLDAIGTPFKTHRKDGEEDRFYRTRLREAIALAPDGGTIDGILQKGESYTGKENAKIREVFPAGVELRFTGQGYDIPPGSEKQVSTGCGGGVVLNILMVPDETTAFKFDTDTQGFDQGKFIAGYTA